MSGLVEFLRARLDEKERRAQDGYYSDTHWEMFTTEAHLGAWQAWRQYFPRERWDVNANDAVSEAARDAIRSRITAHEADRAILALAEVAAARAIIRMWEQLRQLHEGGNGYGLADGAASRAAQLLAAVYADHPDYDERWRP